MHVFVPDHENISWIKSNIIWPDNKQENVISLFSSMKKLENTGQ